MNFGGKALPWMARSQDLGLRRGEEHGDPPVRLPWWSSRLQQLPRQTTVGFSVKLIVDTVLKHTPAAHFSMLGCTHRGHADNPHVE